MQRQFRNKTNQLILTSRIAQSLVIQMKVRVSNMKVRVSNGSFKDSKKVAWIQSGYHVVLVKTPIRVLCSV